jgi:hypothetical protein
MCVLQELRFEIVVMKKAIYLLMVTVCVQLSASAQKYSFKDIVGSWRNREGVGLEVVDSSKVYVVHGEQKKQLLNYNIDFTSNPATFNFVVKDSTGTARFKSMLLFVNDNLIQWQVFNNDGTQPVKYSKDYSEVIILRKFEENIN